MGQKVNPVGLRIGISRDWNSKWFANKKDFADLLNEDYKIRTFLDKKLGGLEDTKKKPSKEAAPAEAKVEAPAEAPAEAKPAEAPKAAPAPRDFGGRDAAVSHVEIERVKNSVNVVIFSGRPGVILGQEGKRIKDLEAQVQKLVKNGTVKLSVVEVKNPGLDATIVAKEMAAQLEARASFRNVQKKAIQRVMKAGAKGIKTSIGGRLGGADIARAEGYKEGVVSLHTLRMDVDYAIAEARTQYGKLGCKVWISRGVTLPKKDASDKKGE